MKKLSLYVNIVLIVAVGLLFYLHFSNAEKSKKLPENLEDFKTITNSIDIEGIVYVNFDTLLMNYDFYYDLQNQLNEKRKKMEAELNSQSKVFENQAADFQNKVQKGLITRARAQEMEQELLNKQQELIQLKDDLSMQLLEEEQVMNRRLQYSILEFLEEYNETHNYQFILSNTLGGTLLFANSGLNITEEVILGINEKYNSQKK